ncbi:hypothetical protein BDZ89DRAFT_1151685 [Hymenopellis radicata]|nr:hypothetical protein BDZ89DRAFT_1151685 [Hymenopellis radicata]
MAKDTSTKKFGKQARTFRANPSVPAPYPQPASTGSFTVIQSDGTIDIARIMSNDNPNAPVLGPNTLAPTHGQAPSSAPFFSYSASMPGANPTAPQYLHPSSVPTRAARTARGQPTPASLMYYYPPMPTAKPSAPLNPRPSQSVSDKEDDVHPRPAPAAIQISPATKPIHSAPVCPALVNDKAVDVPPAKVEKKKFLTIRGCGWLRGVPADVYVMTELASDKFVPATLDEEEEKMFDDFLNPDMIED